MVQANRADRKAGALVGLHYHRFQSDVWYVPYGRATVALHDRRASSATDGEALVLEIGEHDHRGVYIPPGVAWDDPVLGVAWPAREPELSSRDRANPRRAEIPEGLRPA